jgi:DNA repair protein RadC
MSIRRESGERPRERLRALGARNLSVPELIALCVGSGAGSASAEMIAGRVHRRFETVQGLAGADISALESIEGVGPVTAGRLVAALELGRRAAVSPLASGRPVRGPADVFHRVGPRLQDVRQEEFHALLLNTRHHVVREVLVTRGILDASLVHPREVFRIAVSEGAAGIILVHNHPSGDPTPSAEDRAVTRQLGAAGRAVGIPVLDHVIVGRGRYVSLADELAR